MWYCTVRCCRSQTRCFRLLSNEKRGVIAHVLGEFLLNPPVYRAEWWRRLEERGSPCEWLTSVLPRCEAMFVARDVKSRQLLRVSQRSTQFVTHTGTFETHE